jgi:alkylation response protein AidB-like acyl-CoA dehydrogenase
MNAAAIVAQVTAVAGQFARDRAERQQRRALVRADFDALAAAGFLRLAVPQDLGGTFVDVRGSARPLCQAVRALAGGDSSVALVSAMHPAVLALWLATPSVPAPHAQAWQRQRQTIFQSVLAGAWWGTITSEPGSGGDVKRTRALARRAEDGHRLTGQKHFGSGSGMAAFMITTAIPEGETEADWFFLPVRDEAPGMTLVAPWDGHGMIATQSHAFAFQDHPVTRSAFPGGRAQLSEASAPLVGSLFTAVIAGIATTAVEEARKDLARRRQDLHPYEAVEWTRAEIDAWLIDQAVEGQLRAIESGEPAARAVALGKAAVADLAESCLRRICRVLGGGTFARRSPYGHWFEDVRALGFLRPPWGLAYAELFAGSWPAEERR